MTKWPLAQRAGDMETEMKNNKDRDVQQAAMNRVSAQRVKRAIVEDDKERSGKK